MDHHYEVVVTWTGNRGDGTSGYRAYGREHEVASEGKPVLPGSAEPSFRGDASRWNPEELLVASLSQCHMLWYLHLCADAGVVVQSYTDRPRGTMVMDSGGSGKFTQVVLRPAVAVAGPGMVDPAQQLHEPAHANCFIARSVNFLVMCEPIVRVGSHGAGVLEQ